MKELFDKLKTLDVNNDDHWTTQGLPRVEVLGIEGLTRKVVTEAAPTFTRENPVLPQTEDDDIFGEKPEGDAPADESAEVVSKAKKSGKTIDFSIEEKKFLAAVDEAKLVFDEAKEALKKATEEYEDFVSKHVDRQTSTANDIQTFIKSQHAQRLARVLNN